MSTVLILSFTTQSSFLIKGDKISINLSNTQFKDLLFLIPGSSSLPVLNILT